MIQSLKEDSARWDTERRSRTAGTYITRNLRTVCKREGKILTVPQVLPRVVSVELKVLRTRSLNHPYPKVPVVILMKLFYPDTLEATRPDTVAAAAVDRRISNSTTAGSNNRDTALASTLKDNRPTIHPKTKEEIGMRNHRVVLTRQARPAMGTVGIPRQKRPT